MTLEWVGTIPGKRESRRFEGDYILRQQDLIEQRTHEDAVAYGGWSIDLHPADGVFSEKPGCNQWHSKGIFQIPYRSLYSRNINNLFLAGRIISVSHVAFGATRVMATCAYVGQAVGMAAKICIENNLNPRDILSNGLMLTLQRELMKTGQFIPGLILKDQSDIIQKGRAIASSEIRFKGFLHEGLWKALDWSSAQMFPVDAGKIPSFSLYVNALKDTMLETELRISGRNGNYTPDLSLSKKQFSLKAGRQTVEINFESILKEPAYVYLIVSKNPEIQLGYTEKRVTGVLSVFNLVNKAVSNYGKQSPPEDSGVDEFEFWCPQRRPGGHNFAIEMSRAQQVFGAANIANGIDRPTTGPNAWVADPDDPSPVLTIEWDEPKEIGKIELFFDTDYDHPMESVLMTHPENVMPFCVRNYKVKDDKENILFEKEDNYQTRNTIIFKEPVVTSKIQIEAEHPSANVPAAIFSVRCYRDI